MLALQGPAAGPPAAFRRLRPTLRQPPAVLRFDRQHVAHHLAEAPVEDLRKPRALGLVLQVALQGIDVVRKVLFTRHGLPDVLEGRHGIPLGQAEPLREGLDEAARILSVAGALFLSGDEPLIAPQRHPVAAPVDAERPARQRLAGIPLALAEMQQSPRCEPVFEPALQHARELALLLAVGVDVPLGAIHVVDGDERRFAAQCEPDIPLGELRVDPVTECLDRLPLFLLERLRHPRILVDAGDLHLEAEIAFAHVGVANHRCGARWEGRACEGDVALAGEQPRSGVEPDPPGAGQVGLGPGVQVGKVGLRARRSVECLHVGRELDEVA